MGLRSDGVCRDGDTPWTAVRSPVRSPLVSCSCLSSRPAPRWRGWSTGCTRQRSGSASRRCRRCRTRRSLGQARAQAVHRQGRLRRVPRRPALRRQRRQLPRQRPAPRGLAGGPGGDRPPVRHRLHPRQPDPRVRPSSRRPRRPTRALEREHLVHATEPPPAPRPRARGPASPATAAGRGVAPARPARTRLAADATAGRCR